MATKKKNRKKPIARKTAKKRARKNPAKKSRKLTGAAKAAFLKRMAGGRKAAAKKTNKGRKKRPAKKAAKSVKRNPARKRATKTAKTRKLSLVRGRKGSKKRRMRNGEEAAVEFYRKTHGHDPERDTFVSETIHEHKVLVGMGKLEKLSIRSGSGRIVDVTGFRGAVLSMNERGTQLFIRGGDQSVNLKDFDIRVTHETEVLGRLTFVAYHTRKDHLTPETGGTGIYEHHFKEPLPTVVYDVRNKLLTIAGGAYQLKDVGVVR
jgi:hypothetical protein